MAETAMFPGAVVRGSVRLSNGSVAITTLLTAGTNGTRIDGIILTTDETVARTVYLYLYDNTNNIPLCAVTLPAGAGTTTTVAAVNLNDPALLPFIGADGRWNMKAADVLKIAASDCTSGKYIHCLAVGGDY